MGPWWATALADGVVTASIRVGDATRINRAMVAGDGGFCVFVDAGEAFGTVCGVAGGIPGFCIRWWRGAGEGDYAFEQVGTSVMTVGARDGAISLTMELAAGTVTTAVFAVTDEVGGSLRVYAECAGFGGGGLWGG